MVADYLISQSLPEHLAVFFLISKPKKLNKPFITVLLLTVVQNPVRFKKCS